MGIFSTIVNGNNKARVDSFGNISVIASNMPPEFPPGVVRPFRGEFTNAAGASSMIVDGSTTNVDFCIGAASDADRYIGTINILIADSGATLSEFGNFSALTNGVEVLYQDDLLGDVVLHPALKTNWDFMRLANGNPPIGGGTSAYQAGNIVSTSEGYMAVIDLEDIFGLPWGVKIPRNSTLEVIIRIKDAIPAVDSFDAIAYGLDRVMPEKVVE